MYDRTTRLLADQLEQAQRQIHEQELRCAGLAQQARQAAIVAAERQQEATRLDAAVKRLVAKNLAIIGEKRRLRDALMGKHPLPVIHLRIDIDREDTARENVVETLDAFPHRERVREALREARHRATRREGQLRQLRLDTVAWAP